MHASGLACSAPALGWLCTCPARLLRCAASALALDPAGGGGGLQRRAPRRPVPPQLLADPLTAWRLWVAHFCLLALLLLLAPPL